MKQPITHQRPQHGNWADRWNPYRQRDQRTHLLDDKTFDLLLGRTMAEYQDPVLFMTGCLDAPEEIPLGATASIKTIAGYHREEYLRLGREWESWDSYVRASSQMARELERMLSEVGD